MLKSSTVKLSVPANYRVGRDIRKALLKNRPKAKKPYKIDNRFVCPFSVGQIIQHSKRPTINYMIMGEPEQVKRRSYYYSSQTVHWKFRLFTIRGGKLGGRMRVRTMSRRLVKDYRVVSDVDLPENTVTDLLLAPPGSISELPSDEMVVNLEGDSI